MCKLSMNAKEDIQLVQYQTSNITAIKAHLLFKNRMFINFKTNKVIKNKL